MMGLYRGTVNYKDEYYYTNTLMHSYFIVLENSGIHNGNIESSYIHF